MQTTYFSSTFNGTGAAAVIELGFLPDWVRVTAAATGAAIYWNRNMRAAAACNGILLKATSDDGTGATSDIMDVYAATAGIEPYEGGVTLTSTLQAAVTYGEGVYLRKDWFGDYRHVAATMTPEGDAVGSDINKWTLGSSDNRTGNFNADVVGGKIGAGSEIWIDGKRYVITALTAGQGVSANEVTLSRPAPTGKITCISGKFGMRPTPVGNVTAPGFKLNATTIVNVNDELQIVEAGLFGC